MLRKHRRGRLATAAITAGVLSPFHDLAKREPLVWKDSNVVSGKDSDLYAFARQGRARFPNRDVSRDGVRRPCDSIERHRDGMLLESVLVSNRANLEAPPTINYERFGRALPR